MDLGRLVVAQRDAEELSVPLGDIAVLIVAHKQVTYTQAVLSGLMEAGGVFLACDEARQPNGLMLPLAGHHAQTRRMALQAEAGKPLQKRIWQQLIRAKITAQGQALFDLYGDDVGLRAMAARVKSGDPDNLEAQAARKYWRPLFKDEAFRRIHDASDQNAQLNYGYGVLRAIVARASCAAGLHPSLGMHHKNQYNAYCLVDDLMEPYRPIVDRVVAHRIVVQGKSATVDKEFKALVIGALTGRFALGEEQRTLFDCAHATAASLVAMLEDKEKALRLPSF